MKTKLFNLFVILILIGFVTPIFAVSPDNNKENKTKTETLAPNPPAIVYINVSLTNNSGSTVCMACQTWYVSVYEYRASPQAYNLIGTGQALTSGQTHWSWNNIQFDNTNYDSVVLVWHYIGSPCSGCPNPDVYSTPKAYNPNIANYGFTQFLP